MSKAEFIKTLNNTNWESFTIDDLNKYEGLEREILLNQYHIWLWNERKKPLKAKQLKENNKALLELYY